MPRRAGTLCRFKCYVCSTVELVAGGSQHFRCTACKAAGIRRSVFRGYATGKNEAMSRVAQAIREGRLAHPSTLRCADCTGPAAQYEHRDYNKPLVVDPICRRCNLKRGPAIPLHGAIDVLLARGLVPYTRRRSTERLLRLMGRPTDVLAGMPKMLGIEHWRHLWLGTPAAPPLPATAAHEAAQEAA